MIIFNEINYAGIRSVAVVAFEKQTKSNQRQNVVYMTNEKYF